MFRKFFNKIGKSCVLASFFLMFHMEALEGGMRPRLFEEENQFAEPLLAILELCQIDHEHSLDSIVEATQSAWFQKGKERWEFEDRYEDQKDRIFGLLKELQVLDEVLPDEESYDYVFVHGGLYTRARARFAYLSRLIKSGMQFKSIIVLSGERDLDPLLEKSILQDAATEIEMMKIVAGETDLPEDLPVEFVSACKKGKWRPTRGDTIIQWLKSEPKPGKCLAISNQPFVGYESAVLRTYLPEGFSLCTIGEEANRETPLSVHLDNLARWLYQERQYSFTLK